MEANHVQVSIDGTPIGAPITPTSDNFFAYTTSAFTVADGTHTLQFATTNSNGDNTSFIDVVAIIPPPPPPPPSGLANVGFELPTQAPGGYEYNPNGVSWIFTGNAGVQSNSGPWSGWGAAPAPEGQQTAFLQAYPGTGGGAMSQTFTLAAGTYAVSFYAARRGGQVQPIQVSIDGTPIGAPITPTSNDFFAYTTSAFTVADGTHILQFATTNLNGSNSSFIDVVAIIPPPPPPPPSGLANVGFELPTQAPGGYEYNPTGVSWIFTGNAGVQSNSGPWSGWGAAPAPEGQQTAFLQAYPGTGGGAMSQTFTLAAGTYTVQFYAARRGDQVQPIQVSIDGTPVGAPIAPTSSSFAQYTTPSFTIASAGLHTLSFNTTANTADASTFVDAVSLASSGSGPAQVYYIHADHLNTPRLITDASNNVVWRNLPTTEPFGNSPVEDDPNGTGNHFTFNLRFPGQYADRETNTHYNYFRDYDPSTGRYIQADPIGLAGGSMSLYTYADNAPTMKTDPLGLQAIPMPPPPVPGFPLPGSRPKPNDPGNLLDPPSSKSPSFSWPSWLTPKSAAERCEEDCEKQYDRDMDECRAYAAMTRDKYTFVACKQQAERRLSQCMSDCGKSCK